MIIIRDLNDLNDLQYIIAELDLMAFYPGTRMNPASSCSDISQVVESLHIKVALQNAFHPYFFNITLSIDDVYVEGVSLTYVTRLVSTSGHL